MAHPTLDAAWRSYNLTYIERRFPHADRHEGVEFFMALSSAYVSFVAPETISRERLGSMLVVFVGNVLDIEPDALQALFEHALANETEDYQVTQIDFGGRRKLWMLDYEADLPLPLRLRPLPADLGDALESARREHATVVVRIEENRYSFALSHRSILLGEPEGTISVDTLDDVSIRQHGLAATGEEARNKVRGWFGEAELPPPSFQEARIRQACE